MKICVAVLISVIANVAVLSVSAAQGKSVVPIAYRIVAEHHGIPHKLFYAIGLQESQLPLGEGARTAWPWTLNINGKGVYYRSREAMARAFEQALKRGETNIDVGSMQVNVRWHGDRVGTLTDMMTPAINLNLAAVILKEAHERCGGGQSDWKCAVSHYHSHRAERGNRYAEKVWRWHQELR